MVVLTEEVRVSEPEAPAAIALVRDFVNTREPQLHEERLTSAGDLRDWLVARDLLPARTRLSSVDLATAVTLREGLREVLLAHAGHDHDPAAVDAVNRVLADVPVRLVFGADGAYRLESHLDGGLAHAVGRLADAVRQAGEDGTWPRLKVCARDSCRWAFYDGSRNQARRWCSMSTCGNQTKMKRAYAARRGRAAEQPGRGPVGRPHGG
jgi:predicted RNA-binding Zn ribbon-like protein